MLLRHRWPCFTPPPLTTTMPSSPAHAVAPPVRCFWSRSSQAKRSDSVVVTRTGGSRSRSRGPSQAPRDIGLKDEGQRKAAEKIMRSTRKVRLSPLWLWLWLRLLLLALVEELAAPARVRWLAQHLVGRKTDRILRERCQ